MSENYSTQQKQICQKEGCKFKQSKINKYCNKHQLCIFIDETKAINKKNCVNVIRGCRKQLDNNYKFSRCEDCLKKDREKDKQKREQAKLKNEQNKNTNTRLCNTCCKELSIENFNGIKGITLTCNICRTSNKIQDLKRDKANRNKLERERVYYNYTKWAKNRNLDFNIERTDFENLIKMNCYYCNILQENGMNGLDRIDPNIGYTKENCVSCCQMCNYIKMKDDIDDFKNRIEHILIYNKLINGKMYPHLFTNHKNIFYKSYKYRAEKKNIEFNINEYLFNEIIKNECYICGKQSTLDHLNGIDRFDNSKGYILENCRSCCHTCNFMKSDYEYNEFIDKLIKIYNNICNL